MTITYGLPQIQNYQPQGYQAYPSMQASPNPKTINTQQDQGQSAYGMPFYPIYGQQAPQQPQPYYQPYGQYMPQSSQPSYSAPSISAVKIDINGATVDAGGQNPHMPSQRVPQYMPHPQQFAAPPQMMPPQMMPPHPQQFAAPPQMMPPQMMPPHPQQFAAPPQMMPPAPAPQPPQVMPPVPHVPAPQQMHPVPIPPPAIDKKTQPQTPIPQPAPAATPQQQVNQPQGIEQAPPEQPIQPPQQTYQPPQDLAIALQAISSGSNLSPKEEAATIRKIAQFAKTSIAASDMFKSDPFNPEAIEFKARVDSTVNPLLIDEDVFKSLAEISIRDTSKLSGSEKELADDNRITSMWTLSMLQNIFRGEMNKELAKDNIPPIPLNEIPGIVPLVGNIKSDPNPAVREAAVVALVELADPKHPVDRETMKTILSIAAEQDADPGVRTFAQNALMDFTS